MPLLTDKQKKGLEHWYRQSWLLDKAVSFLEDNDWLGMEDYMHRDALIPIARIDDLPDFMRDENGEPLFPNGLNPTANLEGWQDAIEVGWVVMEQERGINHDRVHTEIAAIQKTDWDNFIERAEARDKKDG
jgi:hypothetical protein